MIRKLMVKLGLAPTDEERKILEQLKKPHMKSARVTARGGLTRDPSAVSPEARAFREKCVRIMREADERLNK